MSETSSQQPVDPISAVGVITSLNKAPNGFYVVAQTTDGSDADLWKDALFKSKVTRYLCFTREAGPDVVADMKLTDVKDVLPEGFTPVQETMDTKETAMRKRRLCVKIIPRAAAEAAVYDIQIVAKSKPHLVNYTCLGEINNMGIWYRTGDVVHHQTSQETSITAIPETLPNTASRRTTGRPDYEHQSSGNYTMTALDDVPFVISEKFSGKPKEIQQVNLMGITIKSLAEIEEEVERTLAPALPLTGPSLGMKNDDCSGLGKEILVSHLEHVVLSPRSYVVTPARLSVGWLNGCFATTSAQSEASRCDFPPSPQVGRDTWTGILHGQMISIHFF
ncbi:multivesicular body subunit 12Bb isoform X4 [Scophthalmus maximus]|nr:multivesicular body subunit 12Bb isoform X4 [Scophthalmus maximus]XP_047185192.1 multivesicular body subunit 12Bb isoform X4 [Scophthalmus maximus]